MVCIYCGGSTFVTNSREQKRQGHVWRRRTCKTCNSIFTTVESADLFASLRVKHPATRHIEPFSRDRLFLSLIQALGHRSDVVEAADALTATTIAQLVKSHSGASIEVSAIRSVAHTALLRFDKVAAISYAAYHRG